MKLEDHERTRCEIWSRCMGYHRPIDFWNAGKQQEHRDRKLFTMKLAEKHLSAVS